MVILLDEYLVTLGYLLLANQPESIKVIFYSTCSLADIVNILSNELHVVQPKDFARDLKPRPKRGKAAGGRGRPLTTGWGGGAALAGGRPSRLRGGPWVPGPPIITRQNLKAAKDVEVGVLSIPVDVYRILQLTIWIISGQYNWVFIIRTLIRVLDRLLWK